MKEPSNVASAYLRALYSGDLSAARELTEDGLTFKGPFVETTGSEAFFASAAPLASLVRGHRLLRQWADGGEVCSIFDLALETPAGAGVVTLSEWHAVRDGRIAAARVIFDSAAFRALVPMPPRK